LICVGNYKSSLHLVLEHSLRPLASHLIQKTVALSAPVHKIKKMEKRYKSYYSTNVISYLHWVIPLLAPSMKLKPERSNEDQPRIA